MTDSKVLDIRLRRVNQRPVNRSGTYVLYWMVAVRRTGWNFALQHAAAQAVDLGVPLVILEALRCDYPYASDRLHRFILDGMRDNLRRLTDRPVTYYPYVEPEQGAGKGLLAALAETACLVTTDDFPAFFLPDMLAAAGKQLPVSLVAVDGNGLLPMRTAEQTFTTAYAFRRFLQKVLPEHLGAGPLDEPLDRLDLPEPVDLPGGISRHWPPATAEQFDDAEFLAALPIDHAVPPAPATGGTLAGRQRLGRFIRDRLTRYADEANDPDAEATSGLSPYLHFGHLSSHEIFAAVADHEEWTPHDLADRSDGKRRGWWGMSAGAEAFLDQLITWRELGFNMCCREPDRYREYANLPDWARQTLEEHAGDPRPTCYSLEELRAADTHDPVWSAAQRQLLQEGVIHNYLRMLWGKKILEWSPTPEDALEVMIELNDRYALDGRDPNSYSGIFWCLGRYDRAWGPSRPIFGKVRYMSSENTRKKLKMTKYLEKYQE